MKRRIGLTIGLLVTLSIVIGAFGVATVSASKKKGSEGCTPGFWKAEQHHDSWPDLYEPGDLFADVFGVNAFPGKTLDQVLGLTGGGLNALGRHAVASLLSTASDDVDTVWIDTNAVIQAFVNAYNSGAYEATKNIFDAANNGTGGCPL